MALPDWRVDGQALSREGSPLDILIAAEDRSDQWVRVFLTGPRTWSATELAARPCPICHGRPKPPGWYCGGCDTPKGSLARKGAIGVLEKPLKIVGGKRVKGKAETRKEKRAKKGKREAA